MCIQDAEGLATKAKAEQYRAEQELASADFGQHVLPSETQATIPQSAGIGGVQTAGNDLQIKLARAESACASSDAALTAANQRIQQLEKSNHMQMPVLEGQQQGDAGQTCPDPSSNLWNSRSGIPPLPSTAVSDSSASTREDMGESMQAITTLSRLRTCPSPAPHSPSTAC